MTNIVDIERVVPFNRTYGGGAEQLAQLFNQAVPTMARLAEAFHTLGLAISFYWAPDREVWVAGQGAKMQVRAGLDPSYQDSPDRLIQHILRGGLPAEVRAEIAAEALRGWVSNRPGESPEVLTWHRLLGGHPVTVTRSAA